MRVIKSDLAVGRILKLTTFSVILPALMASCSKRYIFDNLPPNQLFFGYGGGFSGKESGYLFLENGQVFEKKPMLNEYEEYGKIHSTQARTLFKSVRQCEHFKTNQTLSAYSFIRLKMGNTSKSFVFSVPGLPADSLTHNLLLLHEKMLDAVSNAEKTTKKDRTMTE